MSLRINHSIFKPVQTTTLTTIVVSPDNKSVLVNVEFKHIRDNSYVANLKSNETAEILGAAVFEVVPANKLIYPNQFVDPRYRNQGQTITLSHINITDIRNQSNNRHVGTALFEGIFRFSFATKCEGRIKLEAVRNTHYFHYLNGFRCSYISFYFNLAKTLIARAGKRIESDLGACPLYLPRHSIIDNIKKFGISHQSENFATESDWDRRKIITPGEKMVAVVVSGQVASFKDLLNLRLDIATNKSRNVRDLVGYVSEESESESSDKDMPSPKRFNV